jgi:hypothetical protein
MSSSQLYILMLVSDGRASNDRMITDWELGRDMEGSRVALQEPRKTMLLWMRRHIACIEWVRNAPKSYQKSQRNCHNNIKNGVRARTVVNTVMNFRFP